MNEVNPDLAVDLSGFKESQAADLSPEAIEERAKAKRTLEAAAWFGAMRHAFKGISGAPNRRQLARIAIERFDLE